MKHCTSCDQTKPDAEFYSNRARKDGLSVYCRPCHRAATQRSKKGKRIILFREELHPGTELGKKYLALHGIPSLPGMAAGMPFVDLVAWGCVPIEVKTAHPVAGSRYSWGFTDRQLEREFLGEVVMLIAIDGEDNHRVFVVPGSDRRLRKSIQTGRVTVALDSYDKRSYWPWLEKFEDRYTIIEEMRLRESLSLITRIPAETAG